MQRFTRIINKTLSVRLSLMVVLAMSVLLMASLFVMLYFSRKTIKAEALQKASQTLESTVEHIDNILLSVEQTTGNIYFCLQPHLNQPDMVYTYCRQLVESSPYVVGAAIAYQPNYFKEGENFMAYFHRDMANDTLALTEQPIRQSKWFNNLPYTQQAWYIEPMKSNKPGWMNPLVKMDDVTNPIITFCLPVPGEDGKPIAVIGTDVLLSTLSNIVLEAKPSANSYCTLLDGDGSIIVHPNGSQLLRQTAFTMSRHAGEPSVREAIQAMISGESGYRTFKIGGTNYYVFYKPFERTMVPGRSMEKLCWSAGIVYPEDDIFGDYNDLSYYVILIAVICLLVIYLLCHAIIHRQLKPLSMLTESAQRIAKGNFTEPIPDSRQEDEIGRLQDNFQQMQQSLATNIGQLEQIQNTLKEHGESLRKAYARAQKADSMKTTFLHNMTDQMTNPAVTIREDVDMLCKGTGNRSQLADEIIDNGKTIADLLDNLIKKSNEEIGKEVDDD